MFAVWPACNRDRDLPDELHWCSSVLGCRNACGLADRIDIVEVDDIFGYDKLVAAEKATLQKGDDLSSRHRLLGFSMARHSMGEGGWCLCARTRRRRTRGEGIRPIYVVSQFYYSHGSGLLR
jgi:hypothetical protein